MLDCPRPGAKGRAGGSYRGFLVRATLGDVHAVEGIRVNHRQLRLLAGTAGQEVTYTAVPLGAVLLLRVSLTLS